jgi:2-isopropylmalate synthase
MTPQCCSAYASRLLDELLNRAPNRQAPYVSEAAFATKAGIHASAILKEPATYERGAGAATPPRAGVDRPASRPDPSWSGSAFLGKEDARRRLLEVAREAVSYAHRADRP